MSVENKAKKMEYIIEKNIPLSKKGCCSDYPFEKMKIGDSFIVGKHSRCLSQKIANASTQFGKRKTPIWKFSVRKIDNKIRIWRTQ